jgi:hypothetical protein
MARTVIPVSEISRAGIAPPAQQTADQPNGNYIASNDGTIFVEIENTDASPKSVGFVIFGSQVDGVTIPDKVVTVPAGAIRWAGPFPVRYYGQVDASLWINPDAATSLKFRAYKLPVS